MTDRCAVPGQDRRHARAGELEPGDHPRAVRGRRRRVPPQLQPRQPRGAPGALRPHPARSSRRPGGRSACSPTCRGRSCGSAPSPTGPMTLAAGERLRFDLDGGAGHPRAGPAAPSRGVRGARARRAAAARRRQVRLEVESAGRRHAADRGSWSAAACPTARASAWSGAVLPLSALTDKDRARPRLRAGARRRLDRAVVRAAPRGRGRAPRARRPAGRGHRQAREALGGRAARRDRGPLGRGDGGARRPRRRDAARAGAARSSGASCAPAARPASR